MQHIYVERFGGLAGREVGPFGPGLNVVFGPNEAGKSTLAAFVGGVLFGWEDAHGVRNRYLPEAGGRAGELAWAAPVAGEGHCESPEAAQPYDSQVPSPTTGGVTSRGARLRRDEEGTTGDLSVVGDLDRETFDVLFSLSSDELRALRSSSDVMARLLAAGSGAGSSPASAFVEIERRIANTPVYQLEAELEETQERVKAAGEQARLHVQEDRELRALKASRAATAERVSVLDEEIEGLIARRAELEAAETRATQLGAELEELRGELEAVSAGRAGECAIDVRLLALDSAGERVLRDRLDELAEEQAKVRHAVEVAKENSSTSGAAYEALCELDDEEIAARRRPVSQAVVSVLLPIAFIAAGIPLFAHGRDISSLSFTALGAGLLVVAVFLAFAAFFVLFRRPGDDGGLDDRRKDAQWVMLQDRKKLDSCLAEQEKFDAQVSDYLDSEGLSSAEGSIRRARSLLDEAREVRAARTEDAQKASSLELRIRSCERELQAAADVLGDDTPGAVAQLIREKAGQREALLAAGEDMSERFGELTRSLELARSDRTLDQVKFEYQQLRVRLREAKHELVVLLLARRMLERSIATWESQSQPEVNELAGRLLAEITDGRWVRVGTSATGSLVAIGADGVARDPRHLSLGTCQQLYLALRIALLVSAEDIGRAIPVLADDILVNFDAVRRRGAARALAELAARRQVIVFTCHEETAAVLQEVAPDAVRVDL